MLQTQTLSPETFSLLKQLCELPELHGMALAGGTALALQIGHRISVDLDFFGLSEVSQEEIFEAIKDLGEIKTLNRTKSILSVSLREVKVDVVHYKYPAIRSLITYDRIALLSQEDLSAMKLAAIIGRGRKRDFYDLYFLLDRFSLSDILGFYDEKFPGGNQFLALKSLTYFEDAEDDEHPQLIDKEIPWEHVKRSILSAVNAYS